MTRLGRPASPRTRELAPDPLPSARARAETQAMPRVGRAPQEYPQAWDELRKNIRKLTEERDQLILKNEQLQIDVNHWQDEYIKATLSSHKRKKAKK